MIKRAVISSGQDQELLSLLDRGDTKRYGLLSALFTNSIEVSAEFTIIIITVDFIIVYFNLL